MKTLLLMLCVAIGFVLITDPRSERAPAQADEVSSKKPADILLVDALNGINSMLGGVIEKLDNQSREIASVEECVTSEVAELKTRLVAVETKQEEPPAPSPKAEIDGTCSCGCDGKCAEKLADHEARLSVLELTRARYPSVGGTSSLGSTGTPLVSAGSTGTPVVAYKSSVGPVRAVTRTVTAPIARAGHWTYPGEIGNHLASSHGVSSAGMSREQMLDLHDSLHEGTSVRAVQYSPMSSTRVGVAVSNCPGGNCPTSSSRVSSGNGWWLGKNLGVRR